MGELVSVALILTGLKSLRSEIIGIHLPSEFGLSSLSKERAAIQPASLK